MIRVRARGDLKRSAAASPRSLNRVSSASGGPPRRASFFHFQSGTVKPIVAKTFPLAEAADAQ
jgi:hypothetical protein